MLQMRLMANDPKSASSWGVDPHLRQQLDVVDGTPAHSASVVLLVHARVFRIPVRWAAKSIPTW